ncbi:MAG: pyruvate synthase [Geminicoccaceae bacterium]|nr:MAG: pyruvate synthase [Geminicoccaceae bacterium]
MGYFPITPSTEIAQILDEKFAAGEHTTTLIPADGEHGAAGICYGASLGGGRVLNATSANGLLYAIEQLPVQAGTRAPMVLNLVTRAVSGPLDILCDHSDLYYTLNTGWLVLMARDPQAVYDMNLIAVRLGEHLDVRLPVIVASDGFFTSHQKRRVEVFADPAALRETFLVRTEAPYHALDPRNPITFGPYMNDPDMINNKYQLHRAMQAAMRELPKLFEEYAAISGRHYPLVESYHADDAEVVLFLLNSAAETAKDAVDRLRAKGVKVGIVSPNVLRPFPLDQIREALGGAKVVVIGDRADSYGASGGNMTHEVRSALLDSLGHPPLIVSRVYGLGGKAFTVTDAEAFFELGLEALAKGKVAVPFDYYGVTPGTTSKKPERLVPPLTKEEVSTELVKVRPNPETGKLDVELPPFWALAARPKRLVPGHGACPGCGMFPVLDQVFKSLEGDIVVLFHTGCAMVVTTGFPFSAHRVTYIHNLFQNGAATLSGLVEMYHQRVARGELPASDDITFVMISGDGGMDIGMGPALGTAHRNHRMMIIEYDNQGYMNTGSQMSYSTPLGHRTSTSHVGKREEGKRFHHKDTVQLMAATHMPYVFSALEGHPADLMRKVAKAQWYANNEGMVYGKILSFCPLNWGTPEDDGANEMHQAVDSCFFPLYEVEHGKTTITHDPDVLGTRVPLADWLRKMAKTKHLLEPEHRHVLAGLEAEVERRWRRIKAMHAHPDL